MENKKIGIFDSGIGGLTVLKEAIRILPNEDFIYYCDQAHMPYGSKDPVDLKIYINEAVLDLIYKGAESIVLACNTATSLFIENLRAKYPIPIIGMEPALKPAIEARGDGQVLVLATPLTLEQNKFWNLKERLVEDEEDDKSLIIFPAAKLARMIEENIIKNNGRLENPIEIEEYLKSNFSKIDLSKISVVVLGCTHYIFIKDLLKKIFGENIKIIDGNLGTARHLKEILEKKNMLNDKKEKGTVTFFSSDPKATDIDKLFNNILENL